MDKITNNMLKLTSQIKLFGKVKRKNDPLDSRTIDLVNWTLTLAQQQQNTQSFNLIVQRYSTSSRILFVSRNVHWISGNPV